nr:hypothetical protein GCM10017745_04910 [Saccharothrix mutabilis subsp. capreolus]
MKRSGILVFANHSDDMLVELCNTAIWMDEGRVKMHGSLREVVKSYKGRDPYEHLSPETLERIGQSPVLSGNGGE